jgi:hypothetical protein
MDGECLSFKSNGSKDMWLKLHKKKCCSCRDATFTKHTMSREFNTSDYNAVVADKTNIALKNYTKEREYIEGKSVGLEV